MSGPTHQAPYRGLRVLDLGQGVASPYCGYLLAAYGADVIKVEPPQGDWSRGLGTAYGGHTALSAVYNRGKRGLRLDLKTESGLKAVQRLAARSDVFIEGFRPGVAARLGLGWEALSAENPGLVYVSVSGFGQTGPDAQRPCSDSVAQAYSGLVSVNRGFDGAPHRVGTTISDITTGLYAFQAVATTLFARAATGQGRRLDISLTQSTAALLGHKLAEQMLEGGEPRALNAPAGSYPTSDGWIMVTLVTEAQYRRLCQTLDRPDLAEDPRYADFGRRADALDSLVPEIQAAFAKASTAEWLSRLHAADVIAERILEPSEWLREPQVEATQGAVRRPTPGMGDVWTARTPGTFSGAEDGLSPAPALGEHSDQILREAGFAADEIEALLAQGADRASA